MKNRLILQIDGPSGSLNLLRLAFPLIVQEISTRLLNTIHTITLTKVSSEAVAAVGITVTLITVLTSLLNFSALGAAVLMSYSLGRGDQHETQRLFSSALSVAFLSAAVIGLAVCILAPSIMSLYHVEGITYTYAVTYLRIRSVTLFLTSVLGCVLSALRCIGRTFSVLLSNLLSGIVNVLLCILVVNNMLPFRNKVVGVSVAGVAGQAAALITAMIACSGSMKLVPGISLERIKKIWMIGFPSVCSSVSWTLSVSITTGMIASLGNTAVNTNVFVNNILNYVPVFSLSLSAATSVMLGRLFGQGKLEQGKALIKQNAWIAIGFNLSLSLLILLFCESIMSLFTQDQSIIAAAKILFVIDIGIELWRAFNNIYGNSGLVCAKDVVFTSILGVLSCWLVSVGGSWLLALHLGMGLSGCFLATLMDEAVRALCHYFRWKSDVWKKNVLNR